MIMRMMMFTMRMGPYYSNTFKLREMYYQYSHVVENNAQHKWRAEQVTPQMRQALEATNNCTIFN